MPHEAEGMPFLTCLGLSITTRCPVACRHCIVEAGPHRKEQMSAADAGEWLGQAAAYRDGHIQSVIITGGEPFYDMSLLRDVLHSAARHGLVPAVVTNAFWARDATRASALLESLPEIRMLTISTDAYHQRAIPFENVVHAIHAARSLGTAHNVAVCFEREDDRAYLTLMHSLEQVIDKELIRAAAVYPAGRAARRQRDGSWMTAEPPSGACTAADFPTIFPDGKMIGCMGIVKELPSTHPLYFGSLREQTLAHILDRAESNVALHILRIWGPGRLLELLASAGCGERLPRRFRKHGYCDLCYALATDPELTCVLKEITEDKALIEKVIYARSYYMNEEVHYA